MVLMTPQLEKKLSGTVDVPQATQCTLTEGLVFFNIGYEFHELPAFPCKFAAKFVGLPVFNCDETALNSLISRLHCRENYKTDNSS